MFIRGRRSIVRFLFAFLVVLAAKSLPTLSCQENQDCGNGYCKKGNCICNQGWWGDKCEYCRLRLTDDEGQITDGETQYQESAKSFWLIESNKPNSTINLQLEQFATECTWDHLYIYDGKSIDAPLIAVPSGILRDKKIGAFANGSVLELHTKSGAAFLYFYSDKNYVLNGFNIKYRIIPQCSVHCGSHGYCNSSGQCSCEVGWKGKGCDIADCPAPCVHGVCNRQLRQCMCLPHYRGVSCDVHRKSVWSQYVSNNQDLVQGRASHAAGHLAGYMWVYGGYPLNKHPFNDLVRYDFEQNSWEVITPVPSSDGAPENRYGHSLVVFNNSLFVFGGRVSERVVSELWSFDTMTRKWTLIAPLGGAQPLPVTGHTATLVDGKMIVLFGYGNDHGFHSKVQEFDLVARKWRIFPVDYSLYRGTFGHSSVYHPAQKLIYLYGGFRLEADNPSDTELSSELTAYNPFTRTWFALTGNTGSRRFLHSAVLVGNLMLVFGGNEHHDAKGRHYKCYLNYFHAYDIRCDKWYSMSQLGLPEEGGRYGHSALVLNRTMVVFGGFRGTMMNDILTFSLGECSSYEDKQSCLSPNETLPCVWSTATNKCEPESTHLPLAGSLQKSACPNDHLCNKQDNCSRCLSSPHHCEWCGKKCVRSGQCRESKRVTILGACPAHRKMAPCTGDPCAASCYNATTCAACLNRDRGSCMWCESVQRCVETSSYVISFPYGQCRAWSASSCSALKCQDHKTCQDCHTLSGCGWCDDGSRTGLGRCVEGGDDGPSNRTGPSKHCPADRWHFVGCPECQCNGHSTCANGNICKPCNNNTTGSHCEKCKDTFYGNSKNGGLCKACQCNGHAESCHPSSGVCDCQEQGVGGDHCDTCEDREREESIVGNATNGGHCYYVVAADYTYRFPVKNKTRINFQNIPEHDDVDVEVEVEVLTGGTAAKVKLALIDRDSVNENVLINGKSIGTLAETLSHNEFSFGGPNRLAVRVYVFDIEKDISVKIAIKQKRTFLIMNFFITFFGCFFSLLFVVTVAWKIKVRYANYVMSQRRLVEMKQMASRPFSKVAILLAAPGDEDEESDEFADTTHPPASVAFQPFDAHPCAVSSVLVLLPTDENGHAPVGQGGICCASAIVTHAEGCSAHAHTGTRTPRKAIKHRIMRTCLT